MNTKFILVQILLILLTSASRAENADKHEFCEQYSGEAAVLCREFLVVDKKLNEVYQAGLKLLPNPQSRSELRKQQKEWIRIHHEKICGASAFPEAKHAWVKAILNNQGKANCIINASKRRIVRLQSTIPGLIENITDFQRSELPNYLRRHNFKVSDRFLHSPAAPTHYCTKFIEDLRRGDNIEYARPSLSTETGSRNCDYWEFEDHRTFRATNNSTLYKLKRVTSGNSNPADGGIALIELHGTTTVIAVHPKFQDPNRQCNYIHESMLSNLYPINLDTCKTFGIPSSIPRGDETIFDIASCKTMKRPRSEWADIVIYDGKLAYYTFTHHATPIGILKIVDQNANDGWSYCEFTSSEWRWAYSRNQVRDINLQRERKSQTLQ